MKTNIIMTEDGSSTLVSSIYKDQTYHSTKGAIGEAEHVYIRFLQDGNNVLEIGFGSGLNTLLSLNTGLNLKYTSLELYPIDIETARKLSFYDNNLELLHACDWGKWNSITPKFTFRKINIDITKELPTGEYDVVFFDAFAPDIVPEQWSEEVFRKIYKNMKVGGILVTYSAKGDVKRALRASGFEVKRLPGALGKHNMLKAIKLAEV